VISEVGALRVDEDIDWQVVADGLPNLVAARSTETCHDHLIEVGES